MWTSSQDARLACSWTSGLNSPSDYLTELHSVVPPPPKQFTGSLLPVRLLSVVQWPTHRLLKTPADPVIVNNPWCHAQHSNATPVNTTTLQTTLNDHKRQDYTPSNGNTSSSSLTKLNYN